MWPSWPKGSTSPRYHHLMVKDVEVCSQWNSKVQVSDYLGSKHSTNHNSARPKMSKRVGSWLLGSRWTCPLLRRGGNWVTLSTIASSGQDPYKQCADPMVSETLTRIVWLLNANKWTWEASNGSLVRNARLTNDYLITRSSCKCFTLMSMPSATMRPLSSSTNAVTTHRGIMS